MSSKVKSPAATGGGSALVPKRRFPEFRDAGEWQERSLNSFLTPVSRERTKPSECYKGLGLRSHGKGTFLKEQEDPAKNAMDVLYEVNREDLIVNITFAWEGAIAIAGNSDDGALVSHRFPTYTFSKYRALPEFFKYKIIDKQFVYKLGLISPGGAGRNRVMSKTDFLKLKVLLPSPDEQQKIAACLDSVDALIAAQGRKVEALKAHKKGLMQQLFPQEGETQPRLRFPEFEGAGEWDEKSIGDFGQVVTGSTPSTADPTLYGGGIPFVSPADISELRYVDETKTTLTAAGFEKTRPIRAGSVLFVCIGSTIGKIAQNVRDCATNQQINAVIPNTKHSDGFVYFALSNASDRIALLAGKQAVPIINKSLFSSVRLQVPSLPEQRRISDCLTSLDDLIATEAKKLNTLKMHKKGLMQQLFPAVVENEV